MNCTRICSLLALVGLVLTSTAQAQVTLDFENLPNPDVTPGNSTNSQGGAVMQNGFTVTGGSLGSIAPNAPSAANYTGSVALLLGTPGGPTTLTQDNGNPFSLKSVDIANLFLQAGIADTAQATFIGNLQGGGTVTQTITGFANDALATFTFGSDFSNLTSVTFNQGFVDLNAGTASVYQFDNIVLDTPAVSATPEPGILALLAGMSVVGAGFCRRRRKP